jgi:hypothetical protein
MATLKKSGVRSSDALLARQKAKPVIYLEGDSDFKIFANFWFVDLLDRVVFSVVKESQGCTAVVNAVANERRSGIAAFGLVDRDKLMADNLWDLLRETDDAKFDAAQPYPDIKVTRRWEVENYLLAPKPLESVLAVLASGRKCRAEAVVEAELWRHADALIPFAALNQALHLHRRAARGDGWPKKFPTRCETHDAIVSEFEASQDVLLQYHKNLPLIDAFSAPANASAGQTPDLDGLLRIVNGKAMLERIKHQARISYDLTFLLAKEIREKQCVPVELQEFVMRCLDSD